MTKEINKRTFIDFSSVYAVEDIKASLVDDLEAVVQALFEDEFIDIDSERIRIGNKGSLAIKWCGKWYSHEDLKGGDILSLIQWRLGCNYTEVFRWARNHISVEPSTFCTQPIPRRRKLMAPSVSHNNSIDYARRVWGQGVNIIGTHAERYLSCRNIHLPDTDAQKNMRFLSSHYHKRSGKHLPCLLFRLNDMNGDFSGVLRVYLSKTGRKKAAVTPNKMLLGKASGAAIQLSPVGAHIVVTEGPEDALSIKQMYPDQLVWCLVGSNLANFLPPPEVRQVTIAADNDEAGREFANILTHRLLHHGYEVFISLPDIGKDFNDMLMGDKNDL